MSYIILAILFLLSGFFMKYSDDLYDENHDLKFAIILGAVCAIASAVASCYNTEAAYIFIAILIGTFLSFKVDGIHHIVTLVIYVVFCLLFGLPELNLVILLICILAAFADEVGHELVPDKTDNKFLNLFFEYRFVMKIIICLLAVFGVFNILIFVCFLMFEIFYEVAGIVFERLN